MTLVEKTISGKVYLYYQDALPQGRTVTTFVGAKDMAPEEFSEKRDKALPLHVFKLYKKGKAESELEYHFDNPPTTELGSPEERELLKLSYRQIERSLTEGEMSRLRNSLFVRYVHGTTAIEGNTLSEEEARSVLLSDLTPKNKSITETLEVSNYNAEREFIDSYSGDVTERMILQIHRLLTNGLKKPNGQLIRPGEYRRTKVVLRDADYVPPPPESLEDALGYVLDEYRQGFDNKLHPIELAAIFHVRFEEVHPFEDGNGRVGREVLNFMLDSAGYPKISVGLTERRAYLSALREGDNRRFVPIIDFVANRINASVAYMLAQTGFLSGLRTKKVRGKVAKRSSEDEYERYARMLESLRDRGRQYIQSPGK